MITMYGIPNCDTVKKARRWLDAHGVEYRFHDYRKDGITATRLRAWADELGWEALLNRRGTTWRKLPVAEREGMNKSKALGLMVKHPAMIKRPLLDNGRQKLLGFDEYAYENLL